mmetsp:Transcript_5456/g.11302  ORF Transcript_5456/g.11302 Transcript_5456/m.11302 type:complete len:200 (+) Transcript_5456:808-1407(+)
MGFHVFRAVLESAQPARGVDGEETVNEVLGHRLQVRRPRDATLDDLPVAFHRIVGDERCLRREALEGQDANAPPVGAEAMALVEDDLGSEVLWRAAQGPCAVLQDLGEPKVDHLDVAILVEEQVFRLEIPIYDFMAVHVREDRDDRRGVELAHPVSQRRTLRQQREELAAQGQLEQHVQLALVLIGLHESQDEGVIHHR